MPRGRQDVDSRPIEAQSIGVGDRVIGGRDQAAIDADPASFKAYNNYGVALIQGGRTEAAVAMFERAVALNPAFVDARFNLGHVLAGQNRVADAIVQLQEAHRLRPTDAEILYNLAQAFELADRPEDALDAYRHVRVLDPAFPGIEQRVKEAEKKNGAPSPSAVSDEM